MRTCARCGITKTLDAEQFVFQDGRPRRLCRTCTNADSRESHRRRREAKARGEEPAPRPRAKPKPKPKPAKPEPATGRAKDCRYTVRACRCETHLSPGYWLRLERRAQAFADEMERLDREDPEEARRRDAELLSRPSGKVSLR